MDMENARLLGAGVFTISSLLGAYYIVLKIRQLHKDPMDPDMTYVTHAQMDKMRSELMRCLGEAVQDLRSLRSEIREEVRCMQRQYSKSLLETRELIGKNSQNISSLVAQARIANQRICELAVKTDRLVMKNGREKQ